MGVRRFWYRYWDRCIGAEQVVCGGWGYIMRDPVKHGYAAFGWEYEFCSSSTDEGEEI